MQRQTDEVGSKISMAEQESIKKEISNKPTIEHNQCIIKKELLNAKKQIKIYKNEYDMLKM